MPRMHDVEAGGIEQLLVGLADVRPESCQFLYSSGGAV